MVKNDESGWIWQEAVVAYVKTRFQDFLGRIENREHIQLGSIII
jgi:hypothetical protein